MTAVKADHRLAASFLFALITAVVMGVAIVVAMRAIKIYWACRNSSNAT